MKIIYLKNTQGYHIDILEIMKKRGHELIVIEIPDKEIDLLQKLTDKDNNELLENLESLNWDIVFSLNYYPCISALCNSMNKYYVSWNLEPPFSELYSSTVISSANIIFIADKWLVEMFQREGIENVHYLPEGVNLERCKRVKEELADAKAKYECSFIGDTKIASWQELFQTENLLDATIGYLDGILTSQNLVYGRDFFEKGLPDYVYKDLMKNSNIQLRKDSVQSIQQFYAEKCFYPKTTMVDRTIAVKTLAQVTEVNLFSDDAELQYAKINNQGKLPYEERLKVIGKSIINLNIAPRGFRNGLYGHALQIMGMGGLLITDYREEWEKEFVLGEDFVIYDDMVHMADRAVYYLYHDAEREKIGKRAYDKIVEKHTLNHRIQFIEKMCSY